MFRECVIYEGISLILSSAVLFALGGRLRRTHWLSSVVIIGGIAAVAWQLLFAVAHTALPFTPVFAASLDLGLCIAILFDQWSADGHAAFTALVAATGVFLAYVFHIIRIAHLEGWSLAFASILVALQIVTLVLLVANVFEIIDVVCRVRWRRGQGPRKVCGYAPKVSLHVPIHAEPPELVIETLDAQARLEYPSYEILVIDNNTADEALWRPVEAHCAALGPHFRFFHLLPWPGYKSGALNFALSRTAADAKIIGVIDADYVVEPDFLADLVGHFANPRVAFVQTPQDYRDHATRGRYGRTLYLAYQYFFEISMATRNEYNGIIYAGTMGLIRRSALEKVGGWNEWCVTEDAEVSLRLLDAGCTSVYVRQTYGRGIMPLDYAGLKKQRFRWAFGGMQILREHAGRLLNPWSKGELTWSQRLAYLNGGLQWLNDPVSIIFTLVLLVGAGAVLLHKPLQTQPLVGATILMPVLFILFSITRFLWAFRLRTRCTCREAIDAFVILLGLTWIVALACIRGLVSKQGVFLRTPKRAKNSKFVDALQVVWLELLAGTACLAAAAALLLRHKTTLPSVWGAVTLTLLWQSWVYLAAVRSSFWSYAEAKPPCGKMRFEFPPGRAARSGKFITKSWGITMVIVALLSAITLFNFVRQRAPVMGRIERAHLLRQYLPAGTLLAPPLESSGAK